MFCGSQVGLKYQAHPHLVAAVRSSIHRRSECVLGVCETG